MTAPAQAMVTATTAPANATRAGGARTALTRGAPTTATSTARASTASASAGATGSARTARRAAAPTTATTMDTVRTAAAPRPRHPIHRLRLLLLCSRGLGGLALTAHVAPLPNPPLRLSLQATTARVRARSASRVSTARRVAARTTALALRTASATAASACAAPDSREPIAPSVLARGAARGAASASTQVSASVSTATAATTARRPPSLPRRPLHRNGCGGRPQRARSRYRTTGAQCHRAPASRATATASRRCRCL